MGMRRGLGGLLVLGLLVGGVAACGDDDDGGGDGGDQATTTAAAGADGEGGGDQPTTTESEVVAANDAIIQEYCDASEAYAAALEDGDPAALEEASGRLGEASDAVSPVVETFTPEQQAQFEECTDAAGG